MKYRTSGTDTSVSEVTDISPIGIWLYHLGKEYFLPYDEFPWFKDAPVSMVFSVTTESEDHLRWPELDVDLSINSIQDPGVFSLVYDSREEYGESSKKTSTEKP